MRIVVYPHTMELGGSQLNAIQLAAAVRDRGHEVIVLSEPGPLVERVRAMNLEHIEVPAHRRRPSLRVMGALARLVRHRGVDVVHGYEWPPILEAFYGLRARRGIPAVGTIMSMSVAPFVPRTVPLMVGTERIREAALAAGHCRVTLLEPPVDTEADHPAVQGGEFRARHGIGAGEVVAMMVCRLVPELKLEGLLAACDATGELAHAGHPLRLVIVGDGPARSTVATRAAQANAAAGRQAVMLAGALDDPRPAYAAADITIGQGGSALRGMAFAKPLIVVGERGFSELLTPQTAPTFLKQGWYGLGAGSLGHGADGLRAALLRLVESPELRQTVGSFARQLVLDRFSLRQAAGLQEMEYLAALEQRVAPFATMGDAARSGTGLAVMKLRTKYKRWRGTGVTDDSNGLDVVAKVLTAGGP
jgi:glycosyltransferase involved in cell wall biosynthesis